MGVLGRKEGRRKEGRRKEGRRKVGRRNGMGWYDGVMGVGESVDLVKAKRRDWQWWVMVEYGCGWIKRKTGMVEWWWKNICGD